MAVARLLLVLFHGLSKVLSLVMKPLTFGFNKAFDLLASFYQKLLSVSLNHSFKTLIVGLMFAGSAVLILPKIGVELLPPLSQGEFYFDVELSPGTPLAQTDKAIN